MKTVVLVTGGAGYIGSHTCKALAEQGYQPVVYDNLVYGHDDACLWGPLVVGELADRERLDSVFAQYRPAAVMHFAAYTYVGESVSNPARYYHSNVGGTLSLLDAMRAYEVKKLVFSSTCAIYGAPEVLPIAEDTPQAPLSPYGRSKQMMEHVLADYAYAYEMRFAALRYFNACGADPDGQIGERHDPESHLIPRALMAATGQIPHLDVFGDDYPTADGTCIRDYVHVSDLAVAHVLALRHLLAGGETLHLNLGTGRGTSVKEIIEAVEAVTGKPLPVQMSARREGDPPVLLANPEKAAQILGFRTRYNDIRETVQTAWDFHCAQRQKDAAAS